MDNRRPTRWFGRGIRSSVADNEWLLPAVGALAGLVCALVVGTGSGGTAPWAITVDRARDTLIAALGLVFTSLSIVLALASVAAQNVVGRLGSRTLRIYLRRSKDRWVTGAFAFTATFIISEQFQLRKLDADAPAPQTALVIAVVMLVLTGWLVIWYIASMIRWFRVDQAVASVVDSERRAIRSATRHRRGTVATPLLPARPDEASDVIAPRSGYLAEIDHHSILEAARKLDAMVTITERLRSPITKSGTVGWVVAQDGAPLDRHVAHLIDVSQTRKVDDSIEYGLYALVDIAIMALSPAVNDPNSAVEAIEAMSFLLPEVWTVPLGPYAVPDAEAWPRVVVAARTFGQLVELATTQIVLYGITDPNVAQALRRLADSLNLLDLDDADQRYVDEFAAKLDDSPTA